MSNRIHSARYLLLAIGLLLVLVPGRSAASTGTGPPSPLAALLRSDAVFEGVVRSVTVDTIVQRRLGKDCEQERARVNLKVLRAWKGASTATVTIATEKGGDGSGFPFQVGRRYLVYAYCFHGELFTDAWSRSTASEEAHGDLRDLGPASGGGEPLAVDSDTGERTLAALRRCAVAGGDVKGWADRLLSLLRDCPSLRSELAWDGLRADLIGKRPPATQHEGALLAIANLLPFAPEWADADMTAHLFAALVPKDPALLEPRSRSHFGGATEALAACAIYGRDRALSRRIRDRLLALVVDGEQPNAAKAEGLMALAAIAWNDPRAIDAELKQALYAYLEPARPGKFDQVPAGRALEVLALTFLRRPELIGERDLVVLQHCAGDQDTPCDPCLTAAVLALAASGADGGNAGVEAMLDAQIAQAPAAGETSDCARSLLERVHGPQAGHALCE